MFDEGPFGARLGGGGGCGTEALLVGSETDPECRGGGGGGGGSDVRDCDGEDIEQVAEEAIAGGGGGGGAGHEFLMVEDGDIPENEGGGRGGGGDWNKFSTVADRDALEEEGRGGERGRDCSEFLTIGGDLLAKGGGVGGGGGDWSEFVTKGDGDAPENEEGGGGGGGGGDWNFLAAGEGDTSREEGGREEGNEVELDFSISKDAPERDGNGEGGGTNDDRPLASDVVPGCSVCVAFKVSRAERLEEAFVISGASLEDCVPGEAVGVVIARLGCRGLGVFGRGDEIAEEDKGNVTG